MLRGETMAKNQQPGPIQTCLGFLLMCVLIVGGCGLYFESRKPTDRPPNHAPLAKANTHQIIGQGMPPLSEQPEKSIYGQLFLISMLTDLDSFRSTEEFKVFGFGAGGKYHRWLKEMEAVETRQDYARFTRHEKLACGDLMALGMAYLQDGNQQTEKTAFFRAEIQRVIAP